MLHSLKLCLISQLHQTRKILQKLMHSCRNLSSCKKETSRNRQPCSELKWLSSSSFAGMEASSQLKQVFNLMDSNGDGKLSALELKQLLVRMGHEKGEAAREAEGMVREMDCDGDGFIELDEFMITMGSEDDENESVIMGAFQVFDADGNGFISAKELKTVLQRLGCGNCSIKQCRKMIKRVDRDGDGFLSFHDFKFMMTAGY